VITGGTRDGLPGRLALGNFPMTVCIVWFTNAVSAVDRWIERNPADGDEPAGAARLLTLVRSCGGCFLDPLL
jgi:hypothetical protein